VIRLRGVSKTFGPGREALRNVSFRMGKAEFVVVAGPTGSGKSTLLSLVLMEQIPTEGDVVVRGVSLREASLGEIARLRRGIGVIPQDTALLKDRSVFDNVALVHRVQASCTGPSARMVMRALAGVGIAHKRDARPTELSGGEQQLVAIARATVANPWLIVADEPLAGLDPSAASGVVRLLRTLSIRGTALLVAVHQDEPWCYAGARVVRMEKGELRSVDGVVRMKERAGTTLADRRPEAGRWGRHGTL
jgi:cell division transport system ATP-binding protein